jgi:hypothetical protein
VRKVEVPCKFLGARVFLAEEKDIHHYSDDYVGAGRAAIYQKSII